jgi:hypothetical protein
VNGRLVRKRSPIGLQSLEVKHRLTNC